MKKSTMFWLGVIVTGIGVVAIAEAAPSPQPQPQPGPQPGPQDVPLVVLQVRPLSADLSGPALKIAISTAQQQLTALGIPVIANGTVDPATEAAFGRVRQSVPLPPTSPDLQVMAAIDDWYRAQNHLPPAPPPEPATPEAPTAQEIASHGRDLYTQLLATNQDCGAWVALTPNAKLALMPSDVSSAANAAAITEYCYQKYPVLRPVTTPATVTPIGPGIVPAL